MPTTRTAVAGGDDGWRKILLVLGAVGTAATIVKLAKGRRVGPLELLSAAAFVIGLLGGEG